MPTFPSQADRYGPALRRMIESAYQSDPLAVARSLIEGDIYAGQLREAFASVDMILMGVLAKGTPTWSEVREHVANDFVGFMRFTALFNAAGSPTVTAPCGFTLDGRPVGFQLVGKHCDEATLLTAAHAYQQATDWHSKRPFE